MSVKTLISCLLYSAIALALPVYEHPIPIGHEQMRAAIKELPDEVPVSVAQSDPFAVTEMASAGIPLQIQPIPREQSPATDSNPLVAAKVMPRLLVSLGLMVASFIAYLLLALYGGRV